MLTAIIKDNKPFCPKCESKLKEVTSDFFLAENEEEEKYFEFHRRCTGCGDLIKYYASTSFNARYDLKDQVMTRVGKDKKEDVFDGQDWD